jgi:hypothetical protein
MSRVPARLAQRSPALLRPRRAVYLAAIGWLLLAAPAAAAPASQPAATAPATPAAAPAQAAAAAPVATPAATSPLARRLADVEDRLDKVERATILDRVRLGGDYRVMLNTFVYRGPSPNPYDLVNPMNPLVRNQLRSTTEEVWSHRMRLTLSAEPVRSLRVSGRLVMFRHFGDSDAPPLIFDFAATRTPRDSAVRFDRIWIDWFPFDWLAFSAGRIAYSEGNPNELRENSSVRQATWGTHMVDGEYETVNLTFNFGALSSSLRGAYARLFYASWFFDNDDTLGGFPFLESGENLRIIGGNVEFKIPGIGNNFVQLGYYMVPKFRAFPIPISDPAYNPQDNYANLPALFNGSLLFPNPGTDSLGSYQNASGLFEIYDLAGWGLDLFFAGAIGYLSPNDEAISYNMMTPTGDRQPTPFLVLASKGDSGLTYFIYTGFRFTIPSSYKAKFGFEFNYGSRYWISFAQPNDQLLAKLAVRGKAYEAYMILPVNKYLFFRATYLFVDSDYQSGFYGPNPQLIQQMMGLPAPPKTATSPEWDQKVHSVQLSLTAKL